jgi:hypothetical protein
MKKSIIHLVIVLMAITSFQACKKEDAAVTENTTVTDLSITLEQNESYQFTLPANTAKKQYQITTTAKNASISLIAEDANGNSIYQYTPTLDFVGTDNVTVDNTIDTDCKEKTGNKPHPLFAGNGNCNGPQKPAKGNCTKGGKKTTIELNKVNITFIIEKTTTVNTLTTRVSK